MSPIGRGRRRHGRFRWPLAVLLAAGAAGTAVVAPQIQNRGTQATATKETLNTQEWEGLSAFPLEQQGSSDELQSAIADSPPAIEESPGAVSVLSPRASKTKAFVDPLSQPSGSGLQGQPQTALESRPKSEATSEALPYESVQVFYATDRATLNPLGIFLWIQILGPAVLGLLTTLFMVFAFLKSSPKWIWGVGIAGAAILSLYFTHHAWLYGSQTFRLALAGNELYGTRRYLPSQDSYPLQLGIATVTIPRIHQKGTVERPNLWHLEFRESPDKHLMLHAIDPLDCNSYFNTLKTRLDSAESRDAFVFIHGYNVQFEDACFRTAQIAKDLKFPGAAIVYSWPSRGRLLGYSLDESDVAWSVTHLERFLEDLKTLGEVRNLHVIAHSMGNRALLGAIERLALRHADACPLFGQIVLAAPDVDANEFRDRYLEPVTRSARQVTLYTSRTDRALLASKKVHGYPRLGLTEESVPVFPKMDTVEVSPFDTSLLGHSYYGDQPLLIRDIQAIVELGEPASLREWLEPVDQRSTTTAFRFEPEWVRIAGQPSVSH